MHRSTAPPRGRRLVRNNAFRLQRRSDDRKNGLLACLPDAEFDVWKPHLELVQMPKGRVLYESGVDPTHVYFPVTAIVSLVYVTEKGASTEMAVVGNDGVVGVGLFMGGGSTPSRAVVQSAGSVYSLPSSELKRAFDRGGALLHLLLRYTQALFTQMSQTAVCNRHHNIGQQLCRWLLLSLDRSTGDELAVTQESIAHVLGVRREGITAEAGRLKRSMAIRYQRGRITVLDRPKLEAGACECYAVVKKEYDRLLPRKVAT